LIFVYDIVSFYSENGILWGTLEAIDKYFTIDFPVDDILKLENIYLKSSPSIVMVE
jgi:hypothetical protein